MKQNPALKEKYLEFSREILRIGNNATLKAQEENHRLGLPNIYSRNGKLIYEYPNGEIVIKELDKESSK